MIKQRTILQRSLLLVFAVCWMSFSVFAQDDDSNKKEKIKDGWNFGGLPVISYDSDLGLQYGALGSIYHYGDGSRYPEYDHYFYVEASWFTKGSGIFRFAYESDRLIKGIRLNYDITYIPDDSYDFLGFNGYESVYNSVWTDQENINYRSRAFYKLSRKMFRTRVDFQGKLAMENLNWTSGLEYYNVKIDKVDIEKLNKGQDDADLLPAHDSVKGLYESYKSWGLISPLESEGGNVLGLKLGLVYDSRDKRAHPTKGIWTEAGLFYAPSFANDVDKGYLKMFLTHRQYFSIIKKRLTFAYRVGYQSSIVNKGPWYTDQFLITTQLRGATSEGLGGGKSLRGIIRNRVVGDGVLYGNLELRWKAIYFQFIGQNFYIGLNAFVDAGQVVKLIPTQNNIDNINEIGFVKTDYFDIGSEGIHTSFGGGLRIAMNENFIIALDHGRALSDKDGTAGTYIGLNYLF